MLKRIAQNALLTVVGAAASIAFIEAALLVCSVVHGLNKHVPNSPVDDRGAYRILCLGESTTDGQYPWHLEELLNARSRGVVFKVIDKGRIAATTDLILGNLNYFLDDYRPDMVVTMMGINDDREDLTVFKDVPGRWYTRLRSYKLYRFLRFQATRAIRDRVNTARSTSLSAVGSRTGVHDEYVRLSGTYREQKRFREAEVASRKAIESDPRDPRSYTELGKILRDQNRFREAERMFLYAAARDPGNGQVYAEQGKAYRIESKYHAAEEMLRKAIKLDPANYWTYLELQRTFVAEQEYGKAERICLQVIAMDPRVEWPYQQLADQYLLNGRSVKEAEALYRKVLKIDPYNEGAYKQLWHLYRKEKRFDEADAMLMRSLREIREKEKDSARSAGNRARALEDVIEPRSIEKFNAVASKYYGAKTQYDYNELKKIVLGRGIALVCAQYPMRQLQPLKEILKPRDGILFVDNEKSFKQGVAREGYDAYFLDRFAGDFGHCTYRGNRLLAANIAEVVLRRFER